MHTLSETETTSRGTADAVRVAVAGATGYTGQELLRLLARHPHVSIVAATSSGATASRKLPALARIWTGIVTPLDPESLARDSDLVFLALPDAAAAELAPRFADAGVRVIDLSGALRLRDAAVRARWYPETHGLPGGLAYGLTEFARDEVRVARVVANPGCYPTASLLALKPLVDAGILLPNADVIVDAKSGVSGAGKTPTERTHFSEVHGSLSAYGVLGHRHGAEIEQGVGGPVTFTPHLVPLDRGILATIYVRVAPGTTEEAIGQHLRGRLPGRAVRARRRLGVARNQARRAHELLRHRMARGRVGPRGHRVGDRQPAQGRVGPGRSEHERHDRRAGNGRPVVTGPIVLKFGGELLEDAERLQTVVGALAKIAARNVPVVVVHGGGKEIDAALKAAGIEKRQVDGLRITDEPTLDVVVSVLAGAVNTRFVAALNTSGVRGVGLTGADGGCGRSEPAPPHHAVDGRIVDLGRVGIPSDSADVSVLTTLAGGGFVPVVACIGLGADGRLFNVNADTFAGHLAARLHARRLVIAGTTPGVLDHAGVTIPVVDVEGVTRLIDGGTATAGMVAKLRACTDALASGVGDVLIVDGRDAGRSRRPPWTRPHPAQHVWCPRR